MMMPAGRSAFATFLGCFAKCTKTLWGKASSSTMCAFVFLLLRTEVAAVAVAFCDIKVARWHRKPRWSTGKFGRKLIFSANAALLALWVAKLTFSVSSMAVGQLETEASLQR